MLATGFKMRRRALLSALVAIYQSSYQPILTKKREVKAKVIRLQIFPVLDRTNRNGYI